MSKNNAGFGYLSTQNPSIEFALTVPYVKISGEMRYLWRAVNHEGEVLESFATVERDKAAALKFVKKLMKRHGPAQTLTTDGLRSYGAAMKEIGAADRQEVGRWANNRAENSHQPFRRRERAMLRFRRMKTLQKFASVHGSIQNHFNQERHRRCQRRLLYWSILAPGQCAWTEFTQFFGHTPGPEMGLNRALLVYLDSALMTAPPDATSESDHHGFVNPLLWVLSLVH